MNFRHTLGPGILGLLFSLALSISAEPIQTESDTVRMTTLQWPPYNDPNLPGGGFNTQIVQRVFEKAGYSLIAETYPWKRAILMAKMPDFDGYFPEYFSSAIELEFIFSKPVGSSPLGFAMRADRLIRWENLEELKPYRIGTVSGYVNTAKFDEMAANELLKVEPGPSDTINLRKLSQGRLDLVVIDRYTFEYLMATDDFLQRHQGKLRFGEKLLEMKNLYVCFKKSRGARELVDRFNAAILKVDIEKITQEYMRTLKESALIQKH